jgi:hypothetical protein
VAQDYFAESFTLYRICCETGEADPSTLQKWESLHRQIVRQQATRPGRGQATTGRRRPRRRRRRAVQPKGDLDHGG